MTNEVVQPHGKDGKHRDEEWMREQIQEKNRALTDIVDDVPIQRTSLARWRDNFGIEKPLESKEILEQEINNGNGLQEMAEKWDVETYEVKIALEKHNII